MHAYHSCILKQGNFRGKSQASAHSFKTASFELCFFLHPAEINFRHMKSYLCYDEKQCLDVSKPDQAMVDSNFKTDDEKQAYDAQWGYGRHAINCQQSLVD